jgi:tetratricopeptide (TPR) repeat protein
MFHFSSIPAVKAAWRAGVALVLLSLYGCTSMQGRDDAVQDGGDGNMKAAADDAEGAPSAAEDKAPAQPLTEPMLYDILLAEIAGQRGRLDVSIPSYLAAARIANDPRVAERAVKVATYGKQYDAALAAARRWVELDPDNLDARLVMAALALQTGEGEEVLEQMDYVLQHSPDKAETYRSIISMLARLPGKQKGLSIMSGLVARHPGDAEGYLNYSRLAVNAGELPLASENIDKALSLNPASSEAVILKARILLGLERKGEARSLLETAVREHPRDDELRLAYARFLIEVNDLQEARSQLRTLVRHAPDNVDAVYTLAMLALEAEDLDEAERYLNHLVSLDKKSSEAHFYLGYIAAQKGDMALALAEYAQVGQGKNWLEAQVRIADILVKQGNIDEARKRLEALRDEHPELAVQIYLVEGDILTDVNRYKEAMELYDEALLQHPDNADVLYARALLAERMDRLDLAEQDLLRILAEDPDNVRALNALGYTLADRTERYQEALSYIEKAYAGDPDDPAVIDSMGWVQYRLGNLEAARRYLQRAYDMTGDAEIGAHLGEVLWAQGDQQAARNVWEASLRKDPDNRALQAVIKRYSL